MASKLIQTAIRFTPRLVDMIKQIQKSQGYSTQAGVIHQAIINMYNDTFPAYLQNKKNKEKEVDPEVIALQEMEREAYRVKAQEAKLEGICLSLGGQVVDDKGHKTCHYHTYSGKKRFDQVVTLQQLGTHLLESQYYPSKEKVLKLQSEGKVDYEI